MFEAGIDRDCYDRNIGFGPLGEGGKTAYNWLMTQASQDITDGKGVAVVGKNANAYLGFHLIARGLLLGFHQNVRVLSMPRLVDFLEAKEAYEALAELDCLFIEGFYSDHYKTGPAPYNNEKISQLEWLFQWFTKKGGRLFLLTTDPLINCHWWTPLFIARLQRKTMEITVL